MTVENFITNLAQKGAKPALPNPWRSFVFCLIFLSIYLVILLQFFGVRSDISSALHSFSFLTELFFGLLTILLSITAIIFLRLPQLRLKSGIIFSAIILFILLFAAICFNCCVDEQLFCDNNFKCLLAILLFSLVPLLFLSAILRQGVMTNYFSSFLLIGIASGSFSYLAERLINKTENSFHLLVWHFSPIFLVVLLSAILLKKTVRKL